MFVRTCSQCIQGRPTRVVNMDNLPKTWDDWIANFNDWQDRVGFDREWLGDFDLSIQFDWDRAGDEIEFGDYAGRKKWERSLQVPHQSMRDALVTMITVQGDTEFASVEQQRHLLATAPTDYDRYACLLYTSPSPRD